jgi:hypothetical protein
MSNLVEAITNLFSGETLTKLSHNIGADPAATGKAIGAAVPAFIGAMADKARENGGGEALLGLLNSETNRQNGIADGSVLDGIDDVVTAPTPFGGIETLQILFGTAQPDIEHKIGQVSGLSTGVIARLLPVLAPVLMGFLGREVTTKGLDAASLTAFLSDQQGFLRTNAPGLLGFLERIDANDDGRITDDIQRLFGRLTGRG